MSTQDWRQREQARLDAMLRADTARLNELLDEGFVYLHASGARDTKASYLEKLSTQALRYLTLGFTELSGTELEDVCVVTGRMTADVERSGQCAQLDTRFTSFWLNRNGAWSLLSVNARLVISPDPSP